MYKKCSGTLISWSEGHMGPPPHTIRTVTVQVLVLGRVDLSPSAVVISPWLRLQQASDLISHPNWMYAKCFRGTLIWCEGAYGSTLELLEDCAGGGWILGFWRQI
jgi:hypothetical protein